MVKTKLKLSNDQYRETILNKEKVELAIIKLSRDLQDITLGWQIRYKNIKETNKLNLSKHPKNKG